LVVTLVGNDRLNTQPYTGKSDNNTIVDRTEISSVNGNWIHLV